MAQPVRILDPGCQSGKGALHGLELVKQPELASADL